MNVRDIVIAPHRRAVFSTTMRTGIFKDGKLTKQEPGAYRFGYVNVRILYSAPPFATEVIVAQELLLYLLKHL